MCAERCEQEATQPSTTCNNNKQKGLIIMLAFCQASKMVIDEKAMSMYVRLSNSRHYASDY